MENQVISLCYFGQFSYKRKGVFSFENDVSISIVIKITKEIQIILTIYTHFFNVIINKGNFYC